ncbi:MAG: chloride channel protein, partial [Caldimonas sp.]
MHRRDFSAHDRLLILSLFAIVIGGLSTIGAWVPLAVIHFFTNLFFFQTLSFRATSPATHHLGAWVIVLPVIGGLV